MTDGGAAADWYWERTWNRSRRGSEPIAVEWKGGVSTGVVFEEGVPRTAAAILERLPLEIPVVHVAWSGDMIMSTEAYELGFHERENRTRLPHVGDISWDPASGEIAFTYGTAECRLPSGENTVTVFGGLATALPDFAAFCRARRFEGQSTVRLFRP